MTRNVFFLFVALTFYSCDNTGNNKEAKAEKTFFPLASLVNDQWKIIDSLNLQITKTVTIGSKTDSLNSSLKELKKAAEEFFNPDITQPPFNSKYNESTFADQSIPSITLTYSSENKSLPVQRLDILLRPDPIASDKLRNVYMEKNETSEGVFVSKKILLIANRSLQVITSTKDSTLNIVKFTWEELK